MKCLRQLHTYSLYRKIAGGQYIRVSCITCTIDSSLTEIYELAKLLSRQCVTLPASSAHLFERTKYLLQATSSSPEISINP